MLAEKLLAFQGRLTEMKVVKVVFLLDRNEMFAARFSIGYVVPECQSNYISMWDETQYLRGIFITCMYRALQQAAELKYKYIWKSQPDYETFIVVALRTVILQQRLPSSSLVLDIQTREMTCLIFIYKLEKWLALSLIW